MELITTLKTKAFEIKEHRHLVVWHEVLRVYMVVLLIWGFYRLLSPLPAIIEEVFLKGMVFGVPAFMVTLKKNKWSLKKLGFTHKNILKSLIVGLGVGLLLGFISQAGQMLQYGFLGDGLNKVVGGMVGFAGLSLATAFWEQLLFSGYILQRLEEVMPDEWSLVWVVGFLFVLLHVPALLLVKEVGFVIGITQLILLFSLGMASSVLMLRTRSIYAPIMAQLCWGIVIYSLS